MRKIRPPQHEPLDVLGDRYRIEDFLGRGGFGEVYRATSLETGQQIALKLLPVERKRHADGERFQREANIAHRLEHQNTVRIHDFGQLGEGRPFIAYELLEGRSLESLLDDAGPLTSARVARIASQVLESLEEAHMASIVHRDIKPDNIFLVHRQSDPDFVKVLDFGLAKPVGPGSQTVRRVTDQDEIIGSPSYMAPEQVRLDPVGPPADLYALGLVMTEMLTGRVVYTGETPFRVMLKQASDAVAPIPDAVLKTPFGPVVERATQKDPAARYQSAREMLDALKKATAELSVSWQHMLIPGVSVGRISSHSLERDQEPPATLASSEEEDALLDENRPTTPAPVDWRPDFPSEAPPSPPPREAHQEVASDPPRHRWGLIALAMIVIFFFAVAAAAAITFLVAG